jgi:hypothetical protein
MVLARCMERKVAMLHAVNPAMRLTTMVTAPGIIAAIVVETR